MCSAKKTPLGMEDNTSVGFPAGALGAHPAALRYEVLQAPQVRILGRELNRAASVAHCPDRRLRLLERGLVAYRKIIGWKNRVKEIFHLRSGIALQYVAWNSAGFGIPDRPGLALLLRLERQDEIGPLDFSGDTAGT